MGLKLFDGGEEEEEDLSKIEINKEFACRYEHNKKREDLYRYQELKRKGVVESSSDDSSSLSEDESEDDDDDNNDSAAVNKKDLEFFNALIKVKSQDPVLNHKDVVLFHSDDEEEEKEGDDNGVKKNSEPKPKQKAYLKDVVAKRLIEEGPELMEESDSDDGNGKNAKTYAQEQEETRRAFLQAVEEVEGDGDEDVPFLRVREGQAEGAEMVGNVVAVEELETKVDRYFGGKDVNLDENDMFLKEFFLKKMWVDRESKGKGKGFAVNEEEIDELMRDEEELEKQEDYETNFRYEENVGDRVLGHSRIVEDSVRKKDNARKKQRKSKEERMRTTEMERKEELKHLKNLKKEEMKEKLDRIKRIAGIAGNEECPFLDGGDLEDEFDPEEYDRMMEAVFNEKYYDAEDADPGFGSGGEDGDFEKPDFDKEDELLGLPKGWDKGESGDGFLAARERSLKHKVDHEDEDDVDFDDHTEDVKEGDVIADEGEKRKRKRKLSLVKRAKEAMLEEFYKLDYEDTIGDLKTRFKYGKVKPNRFGLITGEILAMDDKELNQYVSLKKIAPYQDKEWKVHNSQRYQLKMKSKELLQGNSKSKRHKPDTKKREEPRNDAGTSASVMQSEAPGKMQDNGSNGDMGKLSKQTRRRRRKAQLKLSHSRLVAYGKITPKSKGKENMKS